MITCTCTSIYTKYTGWCENDFNVYGQAQGQARRGRIRAGGGPGGHLGAGAPMAPAAPQGSTTVARYRMVLAALVAFVTVVAMGY